MIQSSEDEWVPVAEGMPARGPSALLERVLACLCAALLLVLTLSLALQVFFRYVLNSPTVWSEELAISLFVWVAMLAIPIGLRRGEHLAFDFLSRKAGPVLGKIVAAAVASVTIVTLAVIAYFCAHLLPTADRQVISGLAHGLGLDVRVSWVYLSVPVGAVLGIYFTLERLANVLRGRVTEVSADPDVSLAESIDDAPGRQP